MTLTAQPRAATGPAHAQIEELPLSRAMAAGTVDREEYVRLLQHLFAAHMAWEPHAAKSPIWSDEMARIDAISRDLAALGAETSPLNHPEVGIWMAALRERAEVHPEVWLGVIYLFEGSRMGSLMLARPLAQALGVLPLPGHGLDYHLDGAAGRGPRWNRFKTAVDSLTLSIPQQQAVTWGAVVTFQMMYDIYATPVSLVVHA